VGLHRNSSCSVVALASTALFLSVVCVPSWLCNAQNTGNPQNKSLSGTDSRAAMRKSAPTELFVYPVLGPRLSSDYGVRKHPIRKTQKHHHGVDLAAPVGAAIRSIASGQVIFADPFGGYGKFVVIRHAHEVTSHYGHCDSITVNTGQRVRAGQIIGRVGSSGSSTGPHLHLEIRRNGIPQDPEKVLPGLADPAQG
jgi:murein DD-endopeptidase MepM/ murein hydrolase activator NlpD